MRLIDAEFEEKHYTSMLLTPTPDVTKLDQKNARIVIDALKMAPTSADVAEVDAVCEMLDYMLGDCPCNYSPTDEWLPEVCELQDECPNPKEKYGCWRQFIKNFRSRKMDGGMHDA